MAEPVPGGTPGQVLTKRGYNDYEIGWDDPTGGGGTGTPSNTVTAETGYASPAAPGSSLAYARGDHTHGTAGRELPAGGTAAQALTKIDGTDYNVTWSTVSGGGGGTAAATSFAPAGTISATNVQAAVEEVSGDVGALPTLASSDTSKLIVGAATAGVVTLDVSALARLSDIPAGNWAPLYAKAATDSVIANNATATNDTELFVNVAAGAVYQLDGVIFYDSVDAADFRLGFTAPTGSAMTWTARTAHSTVSGSGANIMNLNNVLLANTTACGTYATTYGASVLTARPAGLLTVGGTAGTFYVRWGQFTANAANCARKADSYIVLRRLA